MIKYIFVLLCIIIINSCAAKSNIKVARIDSKSIGVVLFGSIERRDNTFSLYTSDNFLDMLKFEFINSKYSVIEIDRANKYLVEKLEEEPAGKEAEDTDEAVLKKRKNKILRNVFGNNRSVDFADIAGENLRMNPFLNNYKYRAKDIKELAAELPFNYFIQGAVSVVENNDLLNTKTNSYVFLHIFDRDGNRIGMINLAMEEYKLYDADLLKKTCSEIVKEFNIRFKK